MAEKRRGLGRGLGALIPSAPTGEARPVDVFFPGGPGGGAAATAVATMPAREVDVTEEADDVLGRRGDDQPGSREILSSTVPGQDEPAGGAPQAAEDEDSVAEPDHRALHAVPDPASQDGHRADQGHADLDGADRDDAIPQGGDRGRTGRGGRPTTDAGGARGALVPVPGARFADLPVGAITPNPRQPRTVFDQDALSELVASIAEVGVLQPVVVRPLAGGGDRGDGPRYELIMGERRWRATQGAGLPTIPAIIRETEDSDLLRDALLENLHRSDLNPLEEAAAYQQLLDDFGCTHEELALRIHRSRPQISNMLRLLRLPPTVQRRVAAGVLSAGHARALLGLPDSAAMERLAQRIVAEGLSVRTTEEIVALGGEPERTRRRVRTGERDAALDGLAARLSDRLETRVRIELGKSKGRMTVEFASVEDLHRILETLSPHDATALQ